MHANSHACLTPAFAVKYKKYSWTAKLNSNIVGKLIISNWRRVGKTKTNQFVLVLYDFRCLSERGERSEREEEGEDKWGRFECLGKKMYTALSNGAYRRSGRILWCSSFNIMLCCPSLTWTICHSWSCVSFCSHYIKTIKFRFVNFQRGHCEG